MNLDQPVYFLQYEVIFKVSMCNIHFNYPFCEGAHTSNMYVQGERRKANASYHCPIFKNGVGSLHKDYKPFLFSAASLFTQ